MATIQGKIWGNTQGLFNKNNVEIHRIEINKGGFCSKHKHNFKYNMFFVESGTLEVIAYKKDYKLIDKTILSAGQSTIIPPLEYHSFKALSNVVAYEIYWVELTEDIERENVGGKT